MSFSDYLELELLDHLLGKAARNFTSPANLYMSLHSADPGETGANELSGDGYARLDSTWNVASAGAATLNGLHTFASATANWTAITHVGIWDSLTGGNFLVASDALAASVSVLSGNAAKFDDTNFSVTLA